MRYSVEIGRRNGKKHVDRAFVAYCLAFGIHEHILTPEGSFCTEPKPCPNHKPIAEWK